MKDQVCTTTGTCSARTTPSSTCLHRLCGCAVCPLLLMSRTLFQVYTAPPYEHRRSRGYGCASLNNLSTRTLHGCMRVALSDLSVVLTIAPNGRTSRTIIGASIVCKLSLLLTPCLPVRPLPCLPLPPAGPMMSSLPVGGRGRRRTPLLIASVVRPLTTRRFRD